MFKNIGMSIGGQSHQRQKSVLHKDLHLVSRHDRNKSNTTQLATVTNPNNHSQIPPNLISN